MARKRKTADEKAYAEFKANLRDLMKVRHFQSYMWHILDMCGILGPCFTGNSTTFYNEGRRDVGLDIVDEWDDVDPTFFPRLLLDKSSEAKEKMDNLEEELKDA